MNKIVLITGASSGIGWALAHVFAEHTFDVIVIARRRDRLQELKSKLEGTYGVRVWPMVCDLAQSNAAERIYQEVQSLDLPVEILVNNAGFGSFGAFYDIPYKILSDMAQVNIMSLMQLTRLFVPGMLQRRSGHILNVGSLAGFVPGPWMSVYFASKAFVLSFSEALAEELEGSGVKVKVICPGPVQTEFQAVAYSGDKWMRVHQGIPSAEEVARFAYQAMQTRKVVAIPGKVNPFLPIVTRLLPRKIMTHLVALRQREQLRRYGNLWSPAD